MGCGSSKTQEANPNEVDITHFELMRVIGQGGFGKVNIAEHYLTKKQVAIKRMDKAQLVEKRHRIEGIFVERHIMSKVTSSYCCSLLHAFQSPTELYIVMDFKAGGDFRYFLNKHKNIQEDHIRFYCAQIILALQDVHSINVIYRDLKPENLLMDANGNLCLSDFGLGVFVTEKDNWKTNSAAGTLAYMAPEMKSSDGFNKAADVWAFGVVLFEMMYDQQPFSQKRCEEKDFKLHTDKNRDFSPELNDLLKQLLEIKPEKRLGGAAKFAAGCLAMDEVRSHKWFEGIDFGALLNEDLEAPFKPDTTVANCDNESSLMDALCVTEPKKLTDAEQALFKDWEFNTGVTKTPKMGFRASIQKMIGMRPQSVSLQV